MLAVSLFARPILQLLASASFERAADLVPIVCLAYVVYSLHNHFQVPALLRKRTVSLLPAAVCAALLNIGLNLLLIPRWGMVAAAWVSVATFAAYSFVGLWLYRRIDRYDYPLLRSGAVVAAMIATYGGCRWLGVPSWDRPWTLGIPALAWVTWAVGLGGLVATRYALGSRPAPCAAAGEELAVAGDRGA